MNYYVVLGVPIDADNAAIRDAYRSLARQYHPDKGKGSSPEKFRGIVDAYETLSDPLRRREYDRTLRLARKPAPSVDRSVNVPVEPISDRRLRRETIFSVPLRASNPPRFDDLLDELWCALANDLFSGPFARRR
jgi:curved DNA-binding protein CbpA